MNALHLQIVSRVRLIGFKVFAFAAALGNLLYCSVHADEAKYLLDMQDRVRVYVHEWPALTGEYTIGADGEVTIPLIGQLKATRMDTAKLGNIIASKLQQKEQLAEEPKAVVDIIQYRPFYMVGYIERPGEYPYRPGMLVLNAVSIAGGVYRPPRSIGTDWGTKRDELAARGDLRLLEMRRNELTARLIRVRAEADGVVTFPPIPSGANPEFAKLIEDERSIFAARLERFQNQIRAQQDTVALLEREIESMKLQIVASKKLQDLTQRELDDTRANVNRGLVPAPRILPIERALAQVEAEQKALEATILRARQAINTASALQTSLRDERKTVARSDIQATSVQIQETEEKYTQALRLRSESANAQDSLEKRSGVEQTVTMEFSILRTMDDGKMIETKASEHSKVEPGDIVRVMKIVDSSVSRLGAMTQPTPQNSLPELRSN